MQITYLHQYFNTPSMSGGTRSYEMARRLVEMGHVVNMVTSWRDGDGRTEWFETEESGIKVHWLPVPYSNHMSYDERMRAFLNYAMRSARKASSLDADIIFATSTPLTIILPAVYAARRRKVPMVFEVRDLWPQVPIALKALKNPILRWSATALEKWAYANSDAVVALAPGMKAGVVKRGFPSNRVGVIPNGADISAFSCTKDESLHKLRQSYPWINPGQLVVYAGAFGYVNDLEFLVEMATAIQHLNPSLRFAAIGDGARWQEIEALAKAKGVLNRYLFLIGAVPKTQVITWLAASDAVLVLYKGPKIVWEDCVSNKLFDAMAAGKPILSNIRGWGPMIAESVGAGLILDDDDFLKNVARANEALTDIEWLKRAGYASMKLAQEKFNRDLHADQLASLLEAVIDGRPNMASKIAPGIYTEE